MYAKKRAEKLPVVSLTTMVTVVIAGAAVFFVGQAQAATCADIAEMAKSFASARDSGVKKEKILDNVRSNTINSTSDYRHSMLGLTNAVWDMNLSPNKTRSVVLQQCLANK